VLAGETCLFCPSAKGSITGEFNPCESAHTVCDEPFLTRPTVSNHHWVWTTMIHGGDTGIMGFFD
jgi:hypothetical protein